MLTPALSVYNYFITRSRTLS